MIREKDALLQEKETVFKKEREAADAKLMKLKLQAKAKLTSLNKRIEELTEKGSPLPTQAFAEELEYPKFLFFPLFSSCNVRKMKIQVKGTERNWRY